MKRIGTSKQTAASLLLASVGLSGGCFIANKGLAPLATLYFDGEAGTSDLLPDWQLPRRRLKKPTFADPCFGYCPEMEDRLP